MTLFIYNQPFEAEEEEKKSGQRPSNLTTFWVTSFLFSSSFALLERARNSASVWITTLDWTMNSPVGSSCRPECSQRRKSPSFACLLYYYYYYCVTVVCKLFFFLCICGWFYWVVVDMVWVASVVFKSKTPI